MNPCTSCVTNAEELRASLWFIPALIVISAMALAIGLIAADAHINQTVLGVFVGISAYCLAVLRTKLRAVGLGF